MKTSWGRGRPLDGVTINWNHPLANRLVCCFYQRFSSIDDLVTGQSYSWNAATLPMNRYQRGTHFSSSSHYCRVAEHPNFAALKAAPDRTVLSECSATAYSIPNSPSLALAGASAAVSQILYPYNPSGGNGFLVTWNSSNPLNQNTGAIPADGKINQFACVNIGDSNLTALVNGISVATSTETKTVSTLSAGIYIGAYPAAGHVFSTTPNGHIRRSMLWTRALSATDLQWLHEEPFCLYNQPQPYRKYFVPVIESGFQPVWAGCSSTIVGGFGCA